MELTQAQAARFYETLAKLIGSREGVDIKVISVQPRKEGGYGGQQDGKIHCGLQECKAV